MKRKIVSTALVVFVLFFGILAIESYARSCEKMEGYHGDLEGKFSHKAYFILKGQEELGLSDEQVVKIKDLKIETKKELIRKEAELDILALDIETELQKDTVNRDVVDKLIDRKYDIKKEKAKFLVNAYATLKGLLTTQQKDKMKELWKESKKEMSCDSMMKDKMGHQMMKGKMK
ncbi:MAG: hypothetical protein KJ957_02085 [Candidatus Omnitrophica bacterium]|nr:hypothetical protein [Candidatus Omnitrophota bacterium]MBU1852819.1 hypothetical protein [Candidatus Omnitrophota bacterium]